MKDQFEFVKSILQRYPEARDDDMKLYAIACRLKDNPVPTALPFYEAMYNHAAHDLPSYESITRARRKVQQQEEALRGEKYKARHEQEREYRGFYSPFKGGVK